MTTPMIPFEFDAQTVHLILRGLDLLPHGEVRAVRDAIAGHAHATLNPPPPQKAKRQRKPKAEAPKE